MSVTDVFVWARFNDIIVMEILCIASEWYDQIIRNKNNLHHPSSDCNALGSSQDIIPNV